MGGMLRAWQARIESRRAAACGGPIRDGRIPTGTEVAAQRGMNLNLRLAAAGAAAAATLFVRSRVQRAEREAPRGAFVNGMHYVERGFGNPVVLLHGLGSMVEDFELSGLIEQASRHYHVFAFDRPGYGHSARPRGTLWTPRAQARLLRSALDRLGVARPLIVAHSWATQVAVAYGLEYPEHTRGLVLASGYYYPTARPDALFLVPPAIPFLGALLRHTLSPIAGRLMWPATLKLLFSPMPVPGYFSRFPTWRALRPEQLRAVGEESAMLLPVTSAMQREYPKLAVPTVIVAGAEDRYVRMRRHSLRLHRALPQSSFIPVRGAGHMVHHAAPEALMAAISRLS
jgi:pimeloyl-ACP methyl ester carboxylesterase